MECDPQAPVACLQCLECPLCPSNSSGLSILANRCLRSNSSLANLRCRININKEAMDSHHSIPDRADSHQVHLGHMRDPLAPWDIPKHRLLRLLHGSTLTRCQTPSR